ncbi:NUDIX hydrolase [Nonomuraea rhodomycinica]|uniref:NUDIX domain-containing protein n=1 Tax=Nonomuraea rhodomycinica TaxID=1712872 RepID=A0A7Y6IXG8_9ACTN|nr:NUDIX domain-containing protein [Nonomuraea rhodomycinica]NUW46147.1 NUDIX domain-containing protein [Nonomuraea rhodomycinica]
MITNRPTARVILADPRDRVLLFRFVPPDPWPREPAWHVPGGGIEAGESPVEAAVREVREETGLLLDPRDCGEPVAVNAGEWSAGGRRYHTVHTYFFARVAGTEISGTGDDGLGHRWWTLAELAATTERVFPPRLAVLLKDLFQGVRHERPVTLDW